jgi:hypothetical protein
MKRFATGPRRWWFVLAAAAALMVGTALTAVATAGSAVHPRSGTNVTSPLIVGQASGGGCRMGYDTETATLVPPDDSTPDNIPAGSVTITKPCQGAVLGEFTSETTTSGSGFLHIDMRATCTGTGGFTNPCTVGQQVFASPGHTFLQNVLESTQTHAMTMVWTGLKRGIWRFEVLPGGNGTGFLGFRTFVVEAFAGG